MVKWNQKYFTETSQMMANTTAISHELHSPWKSKENLTKLQHEAKEYMPVNLKYFLKLEN